MKTEYKYFHFEVWPKTQLNKTQTWFCYSNSSKDILGVVKWFGKWRRYCFFPEGETVFSSGCLNDIVDFVNQLNEKHKNEKCLL